MTSITSGLSSVVAAAAATTLASSNALASSSSQQVQPSAFSQVLQSTGPSVEPMEQGGVQTTARYLLPAGEAPDRESKPNIAQFMQATGASFEDSSSVLYGVIGSNADLRDWKAIMEAPHPLQAARQAVGAMYNSTLDYVTDPAQAHTPDGVVAQSGNVAWTQSEQASPLFLVDGRGQALRQLPADEKEALQVMQDFGFALKDFTDLAGKLDALGVPHLNAPGAGEAGRVDLRGMAQRATSAAVETPSTANAGGGGATAASEIASSAALQVALQMAQAWNRYEATQNALDSLQK